MLPDTTPAATPDTTPAATPDVGPTVTPESENTDKIIVLESREKMLKRVETPIRLEIRGMLVAGGHAVDRTLEHLIERLTKAILQHL